MKFMLRTNGSITSPSAGTWNKIFNPQLSMAGCKGVKVRVPVSSYDIVTNDVTDILNVVRFVLNGSPVTFTQYADNFPNPLPSGYNTVDEIIAQVENDSSGSIKVSVIIRMEKGYIGTDAINHRIGTASVILQGGTFTDPRDGKVYKTVLMPDGKWWAAENLAWTGAGVDYNNDPLNRPNYGRLYTWAEANSSCPSGTHLPSDAEWTAMEGACGTPATLGTRLKSTTLWSTPGDGTDQYGLAITPGGIADPGFRTLTNEAYYHTSSLYNSGPNIIVRNFSVGVASVSKITNVNSSYKRSVRFIVDSGNAPNTDIASFDVELLSKAVGHYISWDNATMEIH